MARSAPPSSKAVVRAILLAESSRVPARVGTFSRQAPDVTVGRLGLPVDREIIGLKFTTDGGQPIALVWNYAIHGTMLGALNLRLSGDVMGVASQVLERDLGVPVLSSTAPWATSAPAGAGPRRWWRWATNSPPACARGGGKRPRSRSHALTTRGVRVLLPSPVLSLRNCLRPLAAVEPHHPPRKRAGDAMPS